MIYIHESFLTPLKIIIKYFISAVKIPSCCTSWDLSNGLFFSINDSLELCFSVFGETLRNWRFVKNEKTQMLTLLVNNFLILEVILNSLCMARDFGV